MTYESALTLLKKHGQSHLLRFWDELDAAGRESLLSDIAQIDFDLIAKLHADLVKGAAPISAEEAIEPLRGEKLDARARADKGVTGMEALRQGRCAAFLVAGGQGTRLGHDGPKGMFDIGLPSGKSLFQLQAERILRLGKLAGRSIPWYIMTSRENHSATVNFFRKHDFFGLESDEILFFPQAELPLVDADGKILLADKGRISLGPNGNGGCFPALKHGGALEDMRARGVHWVFTYSVDNALVRVCDPEFLGFAIDSKLQTASKAVAKASPEERVGVFCLRDERPSVIEYSEMTPEMCQARDAEGLLYGSANIAVHLFRRDFLEQNADADLPYHVAHKKIPHVDADGKAVTPEAPNAYKFELFMFDLFPRARGMAVLEVERAEEFAPVKNRDGQDSPASARAMIHALHKQWAAKAGIQAEDLARAEFEVSPRTSYAGEGLRPSSFKKHPSRELFEA